ncbi:cyclase family protein [Sphingomonas soli]|uniref:cyclase family protein n=1 Tax=Sphingomonas soli TaxID=266127 RepID=UPI000831F99B|nr:cyclase family protein [Sphingomonas soli]
MSDPDEMARWIEANSNWGRWGADDELGAVNLITPERQRAGAACVRQGRSISLSRDIRTAPAVDNPQPVQHFVRWFDRSDGKGGGAGEFIGLHVHGLQITHIDALSHAWGDRGFWGGRTRDEVLSPLGLKWGAVHHWKQGLVTRGVLIDVAAHRGMAHIGFDRPVEADELEEAARMQGVTIEPGDALVIHSGRDALEREKPDWNIAADPHPGLGASTLRFFRERDISLLLWDLMDFQPYPLGWPLVPHAALFELGIPLVDNCALGDLALACAESDQRDFQLIVAPLALRGGTGSPVNPLAIL